MSSPRLFRSSRACYSSLVVSPLFLAPGCSRRHSGAATMRDASSPASQEAAVTWLDSTERPLDTFIGKTLPPCFRLVFSRRGLLGQLRTPWESPREHIQTPGEQGVLLFIVDSKHYRAFYLPTVCENCLLTISFGRRLLPLWEARLLISH